ncbi:hypothetical protein ACFL6U_10985 [Planctomycetota bacterium]
MNCDARRRPTALDICFLLFLMASSSPAQTYSELWGQNEADWTVDGRLPDVRFAGYMGGEKPIPNVPVVANVRQFEAINPSALLPRNLYLAQRSRIDRP